MFELILDRWLVLRGYSYRVTMKCPTGKRMKWTEAPSMDAAMGLALVANKERVSEDGSDFRRLLDLAASLDVPGLEALGAGIRHDLAWTKVHLAGWQLPKFSTQQPCAETGSDWFAVANTTRSLLQSKEYVSW